MHFRCGGCTLSQHFNGIEQLPSDAGKMFFGKKIQRQAINSKEKTNPMKGELTKVL